MVNPGVLISWTVNYLPVNLPARTRVHQPAHAMLPCCCFTPLRGESMPLHTCILQLARCRTGKAERAQGFEELPPEADVGGDGGYSVSENHARHAAAQHGFRGVPRFRLCA